MSEGRMGESSGMRIFISYRREDCAVHAGRLADNLETKTDDEVFLDVDSIPLGADFAEYIDRQIASCDVVLVMIGDDWLSVANEDGAPRIQDPLDFVHLEVKS